jgi:hypothetical protein
MGGKLKHAMVAWRDLETKRFAVICCATPASGHNQVRHMHALTFPHSGLSGCLNLTTTACNMPTEHEAGSSRAKPL